MTVGDILRALDGVPSETEVFIEGPYEEDESFRVTEVVYPAIAEWRKENLEQDHWRRHEHNKLTNVVVIVGEEI